MLNKEKLEQLMAILGDLTEEQKAIVAETLKGSISEKALFEKLGVDEGKFAEFMQALAAQTEDAVLGQELSVDEMEAAAGGNACPQGQNVVTSPVNDGNRCSLTQQANCYHEEKRSIYSGGFPNCAATVENGSWCGTNDACHTSNAIRYTGLTDCTKAWK